MVNLDLKQLVLDSINTNSGKESGEVEFFDNNCESMPNRVHVVQFSGKLGEDVN